MTTKQKTTLGDPVQESYVDDELPVTPDFDVPKDHDFVLSPEELDRRMGKASWEFAEANRKMRKLETTKSIREKKLRIILLSRSLQYLTNARLKTHLALCFEDPKFKWTLPDLEAAIFIEQEELMSEYGKYEKIAKQASREFEMYQGQMISRMSKRKHEGREQDMAGAVGP